MSMPELRVYIATAKIYEEAVRLVLKPNETLAKNLIGLDDIERNLLKPFRTIKQNIRRKTERSN